MIRFGIVGAGNIAHKFAQDIQAVSDATITVVGSRSLARAKEFANQYDIPHAIEGYQALAESDLIDAVYIATPHNFHKEQSILFLRHKKHVLCEKPIAVNAAEFEEMVAVAHANNVLLMEAMWTRFLPAIRSFQQLQNSGELGRLLQADISFGFQLIETADPNGRLLNPKLAGGSLLDLGVYNVTMLKLASPDPIRSLATSALLSKTGVDMMVVMDIVLDNVQKTKVHLECAQDRWLSNTATLTFEHCVIEIPNFWSTQSYQINGHTEEYPHERGGFEYEIRAFVETIQQGLPENSIMTHQASRDVLAVLDEVRHQIKLQYPFE